MKNHSLPETNSSTTRCGNPRGRGVGPLLVLLLASLVVLPLPPAQAGSLADAIKARRAAAQSVEEDAEFAQTEASTAQLPPGARVQRDVAYGPDPAQQLDVYWPEAAGAGKGARATPVVFMVHGGAWMVGDKAAGQVVHHKLAHWLPMGVALVSINYRMSTAPKVLDQVDDVARALAFVQSRATQWGLDARRVLVMGHSAGAHLVALLASDPALAAAHGAQPWLGTVALDSAALDVPQIMQRRHYRFYDRVFGSDPAFWQLASPHDRLTAPPVAPLLLVCSTQRSDACPPAQAYAAKATGLGGKVTVLPVDLSHADVNGQLGQDGAYTRAVDAFAQQAGLLAP